MRINSDFEQRLYYNRVKHLSDRYMDQHKLKDKLIDLWVKLKIDSQKSKRYIELEV